MVTNCVTNAGVLVVVCPSLFVVTTTTVDWSVVLNAISLAVPRRLRGTVPYENEGWIDEFGPELEDWDGGSVVDGEELGGSDVG